VSTSSLSGPDPTTTSSGMPGSREGDFVTPAGMLGGASGGGGQMLGKIAVGAVATGTHMGAPEVNGMLPRGIVVTGTELTGIAGMTSGGADDSIAGAMDGICMYDH